MMKALYSLEYGCKKSKYELAIKKFRVEIKKS